MADMSTIYNGGNVETTTQSPGVPGVNNDNEFFRQMAMSALQPRRMPRMGPPPSSMDSRPGVGGVGGAVQTPDQTNALRLQQLQIQQAEQAMQEQKHANSQNDYLRAFEQSGPRKKNVFGWGPMTGGFIEDRDSIPYSMRGAIGFKNTPGDASKDELLRQGGNREAFDAFKTNAAQRDIDAEHALTNEWAARAGSTGGGAGGRPYGLNGTSGPSGTDFQQGGLSQRNNYNPQGNRQK